MIQRFLDPAVLAGISSLDLVAKTVVDGFISGLHRSPDFGFDVVFVERPQDQVERRAGSAVQAGDRKSVV